MVSHYTTLIPSLGLRIGPACEAGLSAGMRGEHEIEWNQKTYRNPHSLLLNYTTVKSQLPVLDLKRKNNNFSISITLAIFQFHHITDKQITCCLFYLFQFHHITDKQITCCLFYIRLVSTLYTAYRSSVSAVHLPGSHGRSHGLYRVKDQPCAKTNELKSSGWNPHQPSQSPAAPKALQYDLLSIHHANYI